MDYAGTAFTAGTATHRAYAYDNIGSRHPESQGHGPCHRAGVRRYSRQRDAS
ncbi:hypothetical protein BH23VER1_BH23VER1_10160 [soil metagenome]